MKLDSMTITILKTLYEYDFRYLAKDYGDDVVHAYKEEPYLIDTREFDDNAIYESKENGGGGLSLLEESIEMFLMDHNEDKVYDLFNKSNTKDLIVNSKITFEDGVICIADLLISSL